MTSLLFTFTFLALSLLPTISLAGPTICEGIAGSPGRYMSVLNTVPEMKTEDYNRIAQSAKPFNILASKPKSIELNAARKGLNNLLRKLKDGEWAVIRELSRQHFQKISRKDSQQQTAKKFTSGLLAIKKEIFSYRSRIEEHPLTFHNSIDGHTYFAARDESSHVRVFRDDGNMIWISPRAIVGGWPALLESPSGELRVEIAQVTMHQHERVISVDSFSLPSGRELPVTRLPISLERELMEMVVFPNGRRYFKFTRDSFNSVLRPFDGKAFPVSDSTGTHTFHLGGDNFTYLMSNSHRHRIFKLVDGDFIEIWKADNSDEQGTAGFFVSRHGRLFTLTNQGQLLREPLVSNEIIQKFPKIFGKGISFLETPNGRILLALSGPIDSENFGVEIYDITEGSPRALAKLSRTQSTARQHGGELFNTNWGAIFIERDDSLIHLYLVEDQGAHRLGSVLMGGENFALKTQLMASPSKIFTLNGKRVPGGEIQYPVYQIFGDSGQ